MNTADDETWPGRQETWRPDREGLFLSSLHVSFQRFFGPESDLVDEAPPNLGALPVGSLNRCEFLLPVAPGEGFWIGLSSRDETRFKVAILADFGDAQLIDVFGGADNAGRANWLSVPPRRVIAGIAAGSHFRVLTRTRAAGSGLTSLRFLARAWKAPEQSAVACELKLVDYASYSARTGLSPPDVLDREAGYKGYLLP